MVAASLASKIPNSSCACNSMHDFTENRLRSECLHPNASVKFVGGTGASPTRLQGLDKSRLESPQSGISKCHIVHLILCI